jgi:hypothetical protein
MRLNYLPTLNRISWSKICLQRRSTQRLKRDLHDPRLPCEDGDFFIGNKGFHALSLTINVVHDLTDDPKQVIPGTPRLKVDLREKRAN